MRKKAFIAFFATVFLCLGAKGDPIDSLNKILERKSYDTSTVSEIVALAHSNVHSPETAIKIALNGIKVAREISDLKGEGNCLLMLGFAYGNMKDYTEATRYTLDALLAFKKTDWKRGIIESSMVLQSNYRDALEYEKALLYSLPAVQIAEENKVIGHFMFSGHKLAPLLLAEVAQTYELMGKLDSALYYTHKSIDQKEMFFNSEWNFPVYLLATYENEKGNYQKALETYRYAKSLAPQNNFAFDTIQILSGMATLFLKTKQLDSAIHAARQVVLAWYPELELKTIVEATATLASAFKLKGNVDSTLKYVESSHALQDSFLSADKKSALQKVTFKDELKQEELRTAQEKFKNKVQLIGFSLGIVVLVLLAALFWRNNRREHRSKQQIEKAYHELKSTQEQLIQSEKMASLGQLTAGIAHEIQNPLNFVNNFSEVNSELLEELNTEFEKGNLPEAKNILSTLIENERKVVEHGKRADSIVKGMLQHSRASTGHKEPTDINALCDEYLRLSYHGFRAKEKDFNATIKTDFDPSIGKIQIIPQEIGRVLLNLFNNAFYAINEKKKIAKGDYTPLVSASTKKVGNKVEIIVRDNGDGIPENLQNKIFQPFFTTKPSGQGTGLGLSLSYDIVVKGHHGDLKVKSKESEFTEFIVQLG